MEPGSRPPGDARGTPPRTVAGIDVVVDDAGWRRWLPRPETLARRAAAAALADAGEAGEVTVLLTSDRAMRRLNGAHRGRDKATNVLSFPAHGVQPGASLGDVALALGTVRREAREAGRRPAAHLAHLVAHGTLHLIGHDHLNAGEARRMERAEARALARLRLPNPWAARSLRPAR